MKSVIYKYTKVFGIALLLMAVAFIISFFLNAYTSINKINLTFLLYPLATILFVTAGIGRLGWEIQTFNGNTPAEKLNQWIFRVLTGLGGFLLFIGYFFVYFNA